MQQNWEMTSQHHLEERYEHFQQHHRVVIVVEWASPSLQIEVEGVTTLELNIPLPATKDTVIAFREAADALERQYESEEGCPIPTQEEINERTREAFEQWKRDVKKWKRDVKKWKEKSDAGV
jgi:hypothetical protein